MKLLATHREKGIHNSLCQTKKTEGGQGISRKGSKQIQKLKREIVTKIKRKSK